MLARDLDAPTKSTRPVYNSQHKKTNTNTTLASQAAAQRITARCTGRKPETPKPDPRPASDQPTKNLCLVPPPDHALPSVRLISWMMFSLWGKTSASRLAA
jgi:hypothetical protein